MQNSSKSDFSLNKQVQSFLFVKKIELILEEQTIG